MALKKKILIGYGVSFVLMGLVVVWAVINLVSLGMATEAILSENYRSILAAENMVDALERQDSGILHVFIGDTERGTAQFRDNEANFLEWLARAKDNVTIEGESRLIQSIDSDYAAYRKRFSALTEAGVASQRPLKPSLYKETIYPLFFKVREACIGLRHLNEETMYAASVQAGVVARRAILSTIFVASLALIVALVFSFVLSERIVRPIRQFMEASRKISEGDYSVQVAVETGDELGHLASELNEMTKQLNRYHEMNIEQIISEKNKGEAILSSIEDGLLVFDTHLKVTNINPAARQVLGVTAMELDLHYCADLIPNSTVCELITRTVQTGIPPDIPEEQRIIVLPGRECSRHYLFSITAIRGSDRNLSGIVLLLRDVTRLKEVEQLKNEFVMAASHELRTPLTSLGMSVDLLLEHIPSSLPENDRELLQAAHEEVHRLKAMVNDLLDLSKIEAGQIEMEFESIYIPAIFDHIQDVFRSQLKIKDVELTMTIMDDCPNVRADANKFTWVLTNLVSNALRYVSQGGKIQLLAKKIGTHVHFSVSDDGPGIPLTYQSRIFQKFVQLNGQEAGGSGLGLAICKEIVRAHGGTIWVESAPGRGSVFTFTLPVIR